MITEKKVYDSLVVMQCLSWLFFNFTQDDIKYLKTISQEFTAAWSLLLEKNKDKFSIPDTDFYNLYCDVNIDTRSKIIIFALHKYESEAQNTINWETTNQEIITNIQSQED